MTDRAVEEPLSGGFSNVVVRRGHTVRRQTGPWTRAVHALLAYLSEVGFEYAPRALGIDDQGREILTFIDGKTAWWPWPEGLLNDDGLRAVASMVVKLAEAVENFADPPDAVWHGGPRADPSFRIRHGDLAPWNTVWNENELVGLIDWDTAEPAPRRWDAAQAAWYFIPLRPGAGYQSDGFLSEAQQLHRFAVWCDEVQVSPDDLLSALRDVQRFERDRIAALGAAGNEPYATFLARGDLEGIDADRAWLRDHDALLRSCQ